MAIRFALNHKTQYRYDRPVTLSPQVVRLRPAPHCRTPILSYSLKVRPEGHFLNWQQDPYSNYLARLIFHAPTKEFQVEVDLVADMTVINPFDFFVEQGAEAFPFAYEPVLAKVLIPYLEREPAGPRLRDLVESLRRGQLRTVNYLVDINRRLHREINYMVRMEPGIQTCEETLRLGRGSCRDTGWVLVQVLRHLGLAARFVSGYLIQLKADATSLDGPSGPEEDFTDLHAWAEVYVPGAGWIGLDATSGLLAGEGHIPLACAADPITAAPVTGTFAWNEAPAREGDGRREPEFRHAMSVMRIHEDPRVTRPYTEEQWRAIEALGHRIDERLRAGDVRLTMGGEPTFVSVDDMEGAEWNTTALGPTKRLLAGRLLARLRDRFAPGGLIHHGQGRWYSGESLPRWALSCYWRRDGVSLWDDPGLCADEARDFGHGPDQAMRFARALAERLGVNPAHCMPGYEDLWYYLWKERRLPINVDPLGSQPEDPEERRRLAKIFEQGLGRVVGYALPLRKDRETGAPRWESGPWSLRREHLFLLPGDSPMGFRLPLDSLPRAAPEDLEPLIELDPFAPREPLPP
ncbi:MAG: transglutaminase family protein, partial [Planctomycetaceae bacterium]